MLRGTIPRNVLDRIEQSSRLLDPKGIGDRFDSRRRLYIDSWSELLNLGSITYFYGNVHPHLGHLVACIGIESQYRESSLREKFLGDGAIASRAQNGRQIVQSCLAQNVKGKSAGQDLQEEIITRLRAKLADSPSEPERILAVAVLTESESFDKLNFFQIAQETVAQYQGKTNYGPVLCILPSVGINGTQIVVAPLAEFLPGGGGRAAIIEAKHFLGSS